MSIAIQCAMWRITIQLKIDNQNIQLNYFHTKYQILWFSKFSYFPMNFLLLQNFLGLWQTKIKKYAIHRSNCEFIEMKKTLTVFLQVFWIRTSGNSGWSRDTPQRSRTETENSCKSSDWPFREVFVLLGKIINSIASKHGLTHCSLTVNSPFPGYKYKWKSQFRHPFWCNVVPNHVTRNIMSINLMHMWPYFNT